MYVYFFEKGLNLLCDGGTLSFITPNKYLSANYGKTLRAYLMTNAKITTVLDVSRDSVLMLIHIQLLVLFANLLILKLMSL